VAGRNGRGKTTLLQPLTGQLLPHKGSVEYTGSTHYFPMPVADTSLPAFAVAKMAVGPYAQLEQEMTRLLSFGDENALSRYIQIQDKYALIGL